MSLGNYIEQGQAQRPGSSALAISLALHVAAFTVMMSAPAIRLPERSKSAYEQAIAGKENKLVWYRFKKEMPDVSPAHAARDNKPLRAEVKAQQSMISSPRQGPKAARTIWTPAPELRQTKPVESPNLLAIRIPEPSPPPGRPFVAPPAKTAAAAKPQAMPEAPRLQASVASSPELPNLPVPAKRFTPPPPAKVQAKVDTKPLSDAPALAVSMNSSVPSALEYTEKAPSRPFTAPPVKLEAKLEAKPLSDAPLLTPTASSSVASALNYTGRGPARPFTAPRALPHEATATVKSLKAAPMLSENSSRGVAGGSGTLMASRIALPSPDVLRGNSKDLNVAAVGLNPSDKAAVPTESQPGQFSAGPQLRSDGATATGDGKGLTVPDLFVRGAHDAAPELLAKTFSAPTSAESLRGALHSKEPASALDADPPPSQPIAPASPRPAAIKVSGAPDPRFNGRDVFMMAIQMPNLTSYSGSWLMWYADRTARQPGLAAIAAPIPHRKVDPKYVATAAEERIEGKVQLACVIQRDGTVAGVELVRGIDDRLNQSAEEALSKWQFSPARRNGEPVDVDVLVEIPFRLAPRQPAP